MGSFFVVVAQLLGQGPGALVRGAIRAGVGPAAEHRADEALRLAVGLRPISAGSEVTDIVALERLAEAPRDVAGAVVGEAALVGEHLDVGQATGIVDRDVCVLSAGPFDPQTPVSVDAVSHPVDAGQGLGIEVQELASALALVAPDLRLGVEHGESGQALSSEYGMDGREREIETLRDLPASPPLSPQGHDSSHPRPRTCAGSGAAPTSDPPDPRDRPRGSDATTCSWCGRSRRRPRRPLRAAGRPKAAGRDRVDSWGSSSRYDGAASGVSPLGVGWSFATPFSQRTRMLLSLPLRSS